MKHLQENYGGGGYVAPTLEVLDCVVEQGFAASDPEPADWLNGEDDWFKKQ